MICPNCGHETTGRFCPGCGARLEQESAVQTAAPDQHPAQPGPETANRSYAPSQLGISGASDGGDAGSGFAPRQEQASVRQSVSAGAADQSPAVNVLRKTGSSGGFLLAALLFTLSFLVSAYLNCKNIVHSIDTLDQYKGTALEGQVVGNVVGAFLTVLLFLLMTVALWSIFAAAGSKSGEPMHTGGLRFFRGIFWVALVGVSLALGFVGMMIVINFTADGYSSFFRDSVLWLHDVMERSGLKLPFLNVDPKSYRGIFMGLILVILAFGAAYSAKMIGCLSDARQMVRTGAPVRRVSLFLPVVTLLGGAYNLYVGVRWLVEGDGSLDAILAGAALLLSAVSTVCFALVLFRFRAAMRRL